MENIVGGVDKAMVGTVTRTGGAFVGIAGTVAGVGLQIASMAFGVQAKKDLQNGDTSAAQEHAIKARNCGFGSVSCLSGAAAVAFACDKVGKKLGGRNIVGDFYSRF